MTLRNPPSNYARTPIDEQETVIQWYRTNDAAMIYTSDRTMITKLDKIYPRRKELYDHGKIYAVEYEIATSLLSFRKQRVTQKLTAEERNKRSRRAKGIKRSS